MPSHKILDEFEKKFEKLPEQLDRCWAKLHPLTEKEMEVMRVAVREQWKEKQETKRLEVTRDSSAAPRQPDVEGPVLFNQAADQNLLEYTDRGPRYRRARSRLTRQFRPFFGSRVLREITPSLVNEFWERRMASGVDKRTGMPKKAWHITVDLELETFWAVLKTACRQRWYAQEELRQLKAGYKKMRSQFRPRRAGP